MNIEEIKQRKLETEKLILKLLLDFEKEVLLNVDNVIVNREVYFGSTKTELNSVKIEVRLD